MSSFRNLVQCNLVQPYVYGVRPDDFISYSFTVYHHDNSHKPRKPDHTYVVFEKESAVKSVKKHWAQMDKSNYWKKSCNIGSCIMSCPAAMMNHIKSITGGTSGPATKSQADQNASGSKFIDR